MNLTTGASCRCVIFRSQGRSFIRMSYIMCSACYMIDWARTCVSAETVWQSRDDVSGLFCCKSPTRNRYVHTLRSFGTSAAAHRSVQHAVTAVIAESLWWLSRRPYILGSIPGGGRDLSAFATFLNVCYNNLVFPPVCTLVTARRR